eukprot:4541197-Pyramimonas_sp.AAC.1
MMMMTMMMILMIRKLMKVGAPLNNIGALVGPSWTLSIHKIHGYLRCSRTPRARAPFLNRRRLEAARPSYHVCRGCLEREPHV